MRPFTRSIIDLFDGKKRYLIPLYQRQYGWRVQPELQLLWHDIEKAADRLEAGGTHAAPHFMGAIVISQIKTYGKQVQAYEVIDGQQRLTTFQLMLSAVRDVANAHSPEYAAEVTKYLINEGVMEIPQIEMYKLWPSLLDRAAFTRMIDSKGVGFQNKVLAQEDDGHVRPAIAAQEFFKARVRERVLPGGAFDPFRLEKLYEALKSGLAVVSIELEGGDEPQTIFETLNSRGLDLSPSDLMRNFVFQRAVGTGQEDGSLKIDDLYENYWLPLDRWFWRITETRGRQTRPRVDWMLVDHLAACTAKLISVETLFQTYRSWILDDSPFPDIESELRAISKSAHVFRRVIERADSDPLGRFGEFAQAYDVSTAMPLVMFLANEAALESRLGEALTLIQSYIVRRDICRLPTNNYNRFFIDAIPKLKGASDVIHKLWEFFSSGKIDIARWPNDQEFSEAWHSKPQYKAARQPRLRHLFEAIEKKKRSVADEVVEIKSDLTIEHIMPVKWREHWSIPASPGIGPDEFDLELLQKEASRDNKIHTIGNLTLLTQHLNTSVSNGPFSVKLPAVKAQSALVLNRELHGFDRWDEETMTLRAASLFKIAVSLWPAPASAAPHI
jgi:hypothetical protein